MFGKVDTLETYQCVPLLRHTCVPPLRHVPFLTRPRFITAACRQIDHMYVHVCDQNDNAMYASTRWVPTIRHFLACEDVAGGSQQSGGELFFFRTHFLACEDVAGGSQQSGGRIIFFRTHFLACEDVAGGSQQSGGRIVFFRMHFLACKDVARGSQQSGGESLFSRNTVARPVSPNCEVEE